jgi:ABC-type lipoprotein release transport system permease subunit
MWVAMLSIADTRRITAASVLVIAACLLAAWIPAARAARVDPMRTLRQ